MAVVSPPLVLSESYSGQAALHFFSSILNWLVSCWQRLMVKLTLSSTPQAESSERPLLLPQLPIRSVRPNLPLPFRAVKLPAKAPMLVTAISAASTEMPLEGLPSNASTESRKVVHRKNTSDGARTMDVLLSAEPQSRRANHRRCASTISSAGTRPSSFAEILRQAVLRREINSVPAMLRSWPKREEEAEDVLIDQTDSEGYNLIHCAVSVRCASILQSLLGALPSDQARHKAVNDFGKSHHRFSPLHLATLRQDYAGASILLAAGADPNAQTELKTTPLHLAVSKGDVDIARILLVNGANPNAVTKIGNVPLLSAVHKGALSMVQLLLAAGADPRATFQDGSSPLTVARALQANEITSMMEKSLQETSKALAVAPPQVA